jgi:hypothetical protein
MPARAEFLKLEDSIDTQVAGFPFWAWPLKTVLSRFFLIANSLFGEPNAVRFGPARPEAGAAVISRLSYLVPFLMKCPRSGGGPIDAYSNMRPEEAEIGATVLKYGHLCELIPEVRRGHYRIERTDNGFAFERTEESARAEEWDVLMTELSLPFEVRRGPDHRRTLVNSIDPWRDYSWDDLTKYVKESCRHYGNQIKEPFLLPADVFEDCFGFAPDDLRKTRTALMAVADVTIAMSFATQEKTKSAHGPFADYLFKRSLAWANVDIDRAIFVQYIAQLSAVDAARVDEVISAFSNRIEDTDFGGAGDGYLPPFIEADNTLLFNPYTVRFMLHERNLLYVLNRRDRRKFNEVASPALEPLLLLEAEDILQRLPGLLTAKNVRWREGDLEGEIDLLAYEPATGVGIQIQAKAALPPQGARMTRQVEEHTRKAVGQLTSFQDLPAAVRDRISSDAFGTPVNVRCWISVALSRSGFGAAEGWRALKGILPMNIQLLAGAVQQLIRTPGMTLEGLEETAQSIWADLCKKCIHGWDVEAINILGTVLQIPLLRLNYDEINKAKLDLSSVSSKQR